MKTLTNIASMLTMAMGVTLISIYATTRKPPQTAQANSQILAQQSFPAPTPALPQTPRRLRININITNPEDMKVKEGDLVKAGQILADKDRERKRLTNQKNKLALSIQQIENYKLLPPPEPKPVPAIAALPPSNFSQEEASIESARLQLDINRRNYERELNEDPYIEEIATVDMAEAKTEQAEREVLLQQRRVDAISLENLPPSVMVHETESLKRKITEWEQAQADLNFKSAELENAKQGREERLKDLAAKIEQAQANLASAQSRLEKAYADRAHLEYQHSITRARRTEEENQAKQTYARQQQEYVQQQSDRDFKLAQLTEQFSAIEERLANLSVVRSPYAGLIKRVKTNKQQDNTLSVEISLIPNSGDEFSNPTNNERSIPELPTGTGIQ